MRLIIMRHCKSSWKSGVESDHERPLNRRGREDAPRVARELQRQGWSPDLALVSSARRTEETWAFMLEEMPESSHRLVGELYLAGWESLRAELLSCSAECVLALGHNPGWEEAASRLAGHTMGLTTGNAVLFESTASSWADAVDGDWSWLGTIRPRELA